MVILCSMECIFLPTDLYQFQTQKVGKDTKPLTTQYSTYNDGFNFSVVGLNFDFLGLNVVGFTLYAIFNLGLYFIPEIKVSNHVHVRSCSTWHLDSDHNPLKIFWVFPQFL